MSGSGAGSVVGSAGAAAWEWGGVALVCAVLPWVLLWPAPIVWTTDLLCGPDEEGVQHLWGLCAAWSARDPVVVDTDRISWPTGYTFVLVDPGNLPWFGLGHALAGPVAGLNLVLLIGIALAGWAGAICAHAAGVDARGRAVAAVVAMSTPALVGQAGEGITESFGVGWCGIALGALLLSLQDRRSARAWAALSALAIATSVWAGPYNALWTALLCGAVGVTRWPEWRRTVPVGLLGALGAAWPAWAYTMERTDGLPGTPSRQEWVLPVLDPDEWRGGNFGGADLLDPWLPGPLTGGWPPTGHSAYLGVVTLGCAVIAVARDRARWPWLAGAAAFVVLSLGLYLTVRGAFVDVGGGVVLAPAGVAANVLPVLLRFTRWYRAASVAGILLAPLVALALPRLRELVAFLVVLDSCFFAPRSWPVVHFDARPSPVWAALDDPGAVVELPSVQWSFLEGGKVRDQNLLEQTWHGRPNTGAIFNLSGGAADSREVRALHAVALGRGPAGDAPERLAGMGYRYVVVDRTRFALRESAMENAVGPAVVRDERYVVFRLPNASEAIAPEFPPWRSPVPPRGGRPGGGVLEEGPGGFRQGGPR